MAQLMEYVHLVLILSGHWCCTVLIRKGIAANEIFHTSEVMVCVKLIYMNLSSWVNPKQFTSEAIYYKIFTGTVSYIFTRCQCTIILSTSSKVGVLLDQPAFLFRYASLHMRA